MIEKSFIDTDAGENAFATGSQVYSLTTSNSDVDVVVLMADDDIKVLMNLFPVGDKYEQGKARPDCSIRSGKLNLLCFSDEHKFLAWKHGTMVLRQLHPVTRKEAVTFLTMCERKAEERARPKPFTFCG